MQFHRLRQGLFLLEDTSLVDETYTKEANNESQTYFFLLNAKLSS